uniref:Dnaj Domain-Containing Protein n=1 Tax=Florenciella sp. virus SA2 TaxID=3240092 RepID=A0AB39JCM3_9VIRU
MDHYTTLKLTKEQATPENIKKNYKKMALKYHPDRGGDPEMFKKISEAYQILSDPVKKRQYDNPIPTFNRFNSAPSPHFQQNFVVPDAVFKHFFNQTNANATHININPRPFVTPNIIQRSISTQIDGDIKIQTIKETINGKTKITIIKSKLNNLSD